jgi:hypothetical protein
VKIKAGVNSLDLEVLTALQAFDAAGPPPRLNLARRYVTVA